MTAARTIAPAAKSASPIALLWGLIGHDFAIDHFSREWQQL
jgi:hypothetical protein